MTESKEEGQKEFRAARAIAPGVRVIIKIGQRVSNSILDYALGAAILGLIPVYGRWIPAIRVTLLVLLNLKMIVNVGRFWGYHRGQGNLAIIGCVLAIAGSLILALITWLAIFMLGLLIPLLDSLARAIAYGVFTWNVGHAVSRYYYSPRTLNLEALRKALQFERKRK
ncbi:MAG: hypothetical protein AAFO76_02725 [Cyanobacteria bacterium J06607_15]